MFRQKDRALSNMQDSIVQHQASGICFLYLFPNVYRNNINTEVIRNYQTLDVVVL